MKLLITGAFALTAPFRQKLEAAGLEVTFHPQERQRVACPEQYEAVVCNGLFLYQPIEEFTALRIVQLTSAGLDRMPMDYAREHGIAVYNARGVYSVPMAEFALWGILTLYKQGRFFLENQQARRWEKHRGLLELRGKQVCVVGTGDVGTEIAKRLQAFGCHVTGVNRTARENAAFDSLLPLSGLLEAVKASDIVVLSIALTEETKAQTRRAIPTAMKPGSILVNLARGALVDPAALTAALETKLLGAVLDVFEQEPLPQTSPLWSLENVLITPHNSFVGEANQKRLEAVLYQNLTKEEGLCCKKN